MVESLVAVTRYVRTVCCSCVVPQLRTTGYCKPLTRPSALSAHTHAAVMVTNANANLKLLRQEALDSVRYCSYKLNNI